MPNKGSLKYDLNDSKILRIKDIFVGGCRLREIAKREHVSTTTVRKYLPMILPNYCDVVKEHVFNNKNKLSLDGDKLLNAKEMYLKGDGLNKIMAELHIGDRQLRKYLKMLLPNYDAIARKHHIENSRKIGKSRLGDYWDIKKNADAYTPQLAHIVAHLQFDGTIGFCNSRGYLIYYNTNKKMVMQFAEDMEEAFEVKNRISVKHRNNENKKWNDCYSYRCQRTKVIMLLLNMTSYGTYDWRVPNWIVNGSKKIKSAYLQAFFDDEGGFAGCGIHGTSCNYEGLQQIRDMLNSLGIRGKIRERKGKQILSQVGLGKRSRAWDILITHQNNLRQFRDLVGFSLNYKQKPLKDYLKKVKSWDADKYSVAVKKKAIMLCDKGNSKTSISRVLNIPRPTITRWISQSGGR